MNIHFLSISVPTISVKLIYQQRYFILNWKLEICEYYFQFVKGSMTEKLSFWKEPKKNFPISKLKNPLSSLYFILHSKH